jgi:hypothetical protein
MPGLTQVVNEYFNAPEKQDVLFKDIKDIIQQANADKLILLSYSGYLCELLLQSPKKNIQKADLLIAAGLRLNEEHLHILNTNDLLPYLQSVFQQTIKVHAYYFANLLQNINKQVADVLLINPKFLKYLCDSGPIPENIHFDNKELAHGKNILIEAPQGKWLYANFLQNLLVSNREKEARIFSHLSNIVIDSKNNTFLHWLAKNNFPSLIKWFLHIELDEIEKAENEFKCLSREIAPIEFSLKTLPKSISIYQLNDNGEAPIHVAVQYNQLECLTILVQHEPSIYHKLQRAKQEAAEVVKAQRIASKMAANAPGLEWALTFYHLYGSIFIANETAGNDFLSLAANAFEKFGNSSLIKIIINNYTFFDNLSSNFCASLQKAIYFSKALNDLSYTYSVLEEGKYAVSDIVACLIENLITALNDADMQTAENIMHISTRYDLNLLETEQVIYEFFRHVANPIDGKIQIAEKLLMLGMQPDVSLPAIGIINDNDYSYLYPAYRDQRPPLHLAIEYQQWPMVFQLIKAGASLLSTDVNVKSALDIFMSIITPEIVLDLQNLPEGKNFLGQVLYTLVEHKKYSKASELLNKGGYANYFDPTTGDTCLHLMFKQFIAAGQKKCDARLLVCLENYLKCNNVDILNYANFDNQTPLMLLDGSLSNIKLLSYLTTYCPPDAKQRVAYLDYAELVYKFIVNENFAEAIHLLTIGAAPTYMDIYKDTIVVAALSAGISPTGLKTLLKFCPDIFQENLSALTAESIVSARIDNSGNPLAVDKEILELLQATRNNLYANVIPKGKGNVLHIALQTRNDSLLEKLPLDKLDKAKKDSDGKSPLRIALEMELWPWVLKLLPEKLATKQERFRYGEVLRIAVQAKRLEIVQDLLAKNAAVDWKEAKDAPDKISLLLLAVSSNNYAIFAEISSHYMQASLSCEEKLSLFDAAWLLANELRDNETVKQMPNEFIINDLDWIIGLIEELYKQLQETQEHEVKDTDSGDFQERSNNVYIEELDATLQDESTAEPTISMTSKQADAVKPSVLSYFWSLPGVATFARKSTLEKKGALVV